MTEWRRVTMLVKFADGSDATFQVSAAADKQEGLEAAADYALADHPMADSWTSIVLTIVRADVPEDELTAGYPL